jgi:hypothetical protein
MTDAQWRDLLRVLAGERLEGLPVGFIVDSPWLPGWAGTTILDYLTDDSRWLEANLQACRRFPQVMFLPGFWAEHGMCTEPSAFGAKCIWPGHLLGRRRDAAGRAEREHRRLLRRGGGVGLGGVRPSAISYQPSAVSGRQSAIIDQIAYPNTPES